MLKFLSVFALVCATCLGGLSYADTQVASKADVRAVADEYIKGTYEADTALLEKVFHSSAVMNGYHTGNLRLGGPTPFIKQIGSMPSLKSSGATYKATVDYIHVSGNIGSVTITESGLGPHDFVNYLHLLKADGEWKIVSKTFTTK